MEFNYTDLTIPDRDAWPGGESSLEGLSIYINGSKIDEGTGADVFSPNPIIKHS